MSELYTQNGRVRGKCSVCGTEEVHKQNRNPKYFKPFYFSVFEKVSWFRGDDEYRGRICKDCLKSGFISKAHKQPHPQSQSTKEER